MANEKYTAERSTAGGDKPTQHQYATKGTNKGRVDVTPMFPGEIGDYGKGKGKARIAPPFPPDRSVDPGNEGGYRARASGGFNKE
jgi:hypothetical protein